MFRKYQQEFRELWMFSIDILNITYLHFAGSRMLIVIVVNMCMYVNLTITNNSVPIRKIIICLLLQAII